MASKDLLTIHVSLTGPEENLSRRDIDLRDRRAGFAEIGFHYVITRDGEIHHGRSLLSASVHDDIHVAKRAVSVLLIGGKGEPAFTMEQKLALKLVVDADGGFEELPAEVRVVTPGFNLIDLLP